MNYIYSNGWKIYLNIFQNMQEGKYMASIRSAVNSDNENSSLIKEPFFLHSSKRLLSLPLIDDIKNNARYLAAGFVYDEYGHLGLHRIEVRNNKSYIFIANKSYFDNKTGDIKIKIFNTPLLKYIFAASFHMENIQKFLMNYDSQNAVFNGIIPYSTSFLIDAAITRQTGTFNEELSFGSERIRRPLEYNRLEIANIKFNKKECYGIEQGGIDHIFLYKLGKALNFNNDKV
ncbi:MAG: hypothetical protein QXZ44_04675 [Ferroplasma sp.]